MGPERAPGQNQRCPYHRGGGDQATSTSVAENPNPQSAVTVDTERLAHQVRGLNAGYSPSNLSLAIHRIESSCPVSADEHHGLQRSSANEALIEVNAIAGIFLEKMCHDLFAWIHSVRANANCVPLVKFHHSGALGAYTTHDLTKLIANDNTLEEKLIRVRDAMLLTAHRFTGPSGNYGQRNLANFSLQELELIESFTQLPKFDSVAVAGDTHSYLNALVSAGMETGLSVMTKYTLVVFELLQQQYGRPPDEHVFKACFANSLDFAIDMMQRPLAIAQTLDLLLSRSQASSSVGIDFYEPNNFVLYQEEDTRAPAVGPRKGLIETLEPQIRDALRRGEGRDGATQHTKCPFLFASYRNTPQIHSLAAWVSDVAWRAAFCSQQQLPSR